MRAASIVVAALLASGCDSSPGVNGGNVTGEMIERIAKQQNIVADVSATVRLQPLGPVGVVGGAGGAPCRFTRDDNLLFIASGETGAARIDGTTRNLRVEGSVGPTGGFFRDREIGVSIGVAQGGAARIVVTNRLTDAREEAIGSWSCESGSR